jgi:hypothetical protein
MQYKIYKQNIYTKIDNWANQIDVVYALGFVRINKQRRLQCFIKRNINSTMNYSYSSKAEWSLVLTK